MLPCSPLELADIHLYTVTLSSVRLLLMELTDELYNPTE